MIIKHLKNTSEITTEDGSVISMRVSKTLILEPNAGMLLRNKRTGETFNCTIVLSSKEKLEDYEEIEA